MNIHIKKFSLCYHNLYGVCVCACVCVCVHVHQVQVVFWYLQCNNLPEAQTSLQHDTDAEDETTHMWDHHQCRGRQEIQILCVCACACKKNLCKHCMTKVFIDKICGLCYPVFVYFWSLFAAFETPLVSMRIFTKHFSTHIIVSRAHGALVVFLANSRT